MSDEEREHLKESFAKLEQSEIKVYDGDEADAILRAAIGIPNDNGIDGSITISRERMTVALRELFAQLPDLLAEHSEEMPVYARAALPVVRMLLASTEMQETLTGDAIVGYVWDALYKCQ
jgi:hypothetical protein